MKRIGMAVLVLVGGMVGGMLFCWAQALTHQPGSAYFDDVDAASPHNEDIGFLVEYGVTSGTTTTTYSPSMAVSRDQMASFLMRSSVRDSMMSWMLIDRLYFNGYYTGYQAYLDGIITYEEYQALEARMAWWYEVCKYEASQVQAGTYSAATFKIFQRAHKDLIHPDRLLGRPRE